MDKFYLAGEFETNSEASLIVWIKFNQDFLHAWNARQTPLVNTDGEPILDENGHEIFKETYDKNYKELKEQFENEVTWLHTTFSQP